MTTRTKQTLAGRWRRGLPERPDDEMGEVALAEWDRIVPVLHEEGILSPEDRVILMVWCETWADWLMVDEHLSSLDRLTTTGSRGNEIVSPLAKIRREMGQFLLQLAPQIGVSPASRFKMPTPSRPPPLPRSTTPPPIPEGGDPRAVLG